MVRSQASRFGSLRSYQNVSFKDSDRPMNAVDMVIRARIFPDATMARPSFAPSPIVATSVVAAPVTPNTAAVKMEYIKIGNNIAIVMARGNCDDRTWCE